MYKYEHFVSKTTRALIVEPAWATWLLVRLDAGDGGHKGAPVLPRDRMGGAGGAAGDATVPAAGGERARPDALRPAVHEGGATPLARRPERHREARPERVRWLGVREPAAARARAVRLNAAMIWVQTNFSMWASALDTAFNVCVTLQLNELRQSHN